ncbi:Fur family transcriptional regulator [Atopobacter phocae]|uniref:Fur family transcriptional regulator n=1 Tax=Atopobacter phocae TaxID=136492 RepID=UPI0004710502|nr:Fur family transcriptional regulator [Atopobacter phocae]
MSKELNIEWAIERLKEANYKYTDKREALVRYFVDKDRYLSAKDVQEYMSEQFPSLSFDTIYRNLYLFTELGVLESTELNGEKYFHFACRLSGHHHHHFICKNCGKIKALDVCPMSIMGEQLEGYNVETHRFEVYGLCPDCKK